MGNDLDAARAKLLTGSVALIAEAEATFARCGAVRLRDEAARTLRRHGRRVARQGRRGRRPASGVAALTDREREVAALVATGDSNRRIAAQLHLSTKTVETHLAHIFGSSGCGPGPRSPRFCCRRNMRARSRSMSSRSIRAAADG